MENSVQRKARMILAGLAAMPAIATAKAGSEVIQSNGYCAPYSDCDESSANLTQVTGLSAQELKQGRDLVSELNQLDVVTAKEIVLTKAPRVPYMYNMPVPAEVDSARVKNLERLTKLRAMIEAAK